MMQKILDKRVRAVADWDIDIAWKAFKLNYPKDAKRIGYYQYKSIIHHSNKLIGRIILDNVDGFKLPRSLGNLSIKKYKFAHLNADSMPIDWKSTHQEGKRVLEFNAHTDGYRFKFFWDKTRANFRQSILYLFQADRKLKRELAYLLKNKMRDYHIASKESMISYFKKKKQRSLWKRNNTIKYDNSTMDKH